MRDPERIKRIIDKLAVLWHSQIDTRLGQLVSNMTRMSGYTGDVFFVEDDTIEAEIDRQLIQLGIKPVTLKS